MATPRKAWKRKLAEAHIKAICRKNRIKIRWVKGAGWMDKAEASERAMLVHIPRPFNHRQYLVALHEIGHILSPIRYSMSHEVDWGPGVFHLACEAAADAWAMEHIHPELLRLLDRDLDINPTVGLGFASHAWAVACYDPAG